jgi:hypothetical protein
VDTDQVRGVIFLCPWSSVDAEAATLPQEGNEPDNALDEARTWYFFRSPTDSLLSRCQPGGISESTVLTDFFLERRREGGGAIRIQAVAVVCVPMLAGRADFWSYPDAIVSQRSPTPNSSSEVFPFVTGRVSSADFRSHLSLPFVFGCRRRRGRPFARRKFHSPLLRVLGSE